jgi:hypothetical protein
MRQLRPGDRARIVDASEDFSHFLGHTGHVVEKDEPTDEDDVWLRTDSGQFIKGERHHFLKIEEDPRS